MRCLLQCNGKEETVQWAWPLIQPPHEKDASSWQLLANCYCHTGNVFGKLNVIVCYVRSPFGVFINSSTNLVILASIQLSIINLSINSPY